MEGNINLRRSQSLRSFSDSCEKLIWTDVGLRDKASSVSDLVARYQTGKAKGSTAAKPPPADQSREQRVETPQEKTPTPQKTPLKSILKKTGGKSPVAAALSPAKSTESLQSSTASIMSLKAKYEAKAAAEKEKSSFRAANSSAPLNDKPVMNGETQHAKAAAEHKKSPETLQTVSSNAETEQELVKSTESLQSSNTSIMSLKAKYEAKAAAEKEKSSFRAANSSAPNLNPKNKLVNNRDAQHSKAAAEDKRSLETLQNASSNSETEQELVKSTESSTMSIMSLKAKYEAKVAAEKEKSSFRAANSSAPLKDKPVMTVDAHDAKAAAEDKKSPETPQKVPTNTGTKQELVAKKAAKAERSERRRTIGGIDFEKIAASNAGERRKSIADLRESAFIEAKEKLSVSVREMSALYQSKVASQESNNALLKPEHDPSAEPLRRGRSFKMAEDAPPPPDVPGTRRPLHGPSHFSKEMLHQQRQKCELRRLLKHTHPELKVLDGVVDQELAEVLSSEGGTAAETGYEGEVFSRCLIFENSGLKDKVSPYGSKTHMAEGSGERCGIKKTAAALKEPRETGTVETHAEDDKPLVFRPDPDRDTEEESVKIDVQATRRMFESQSVDTIRSHSDSAQTHVSVSGYEPNGQKQKIEFDSGRKPEVHGRSSEREIPSAASAAQILSEEEFESSPEAGPGSALIKTSAALLQNNPFVATNIEREDSYRSKAPVTEEDGGAANVRNRTHLFESMPFDKIRQQNKEEIESMVENIKETLDLLHRASAIHSFGSIIEVNETMIARKAKFTLSPRGPEISYDQVAEGGAQNLVLHSLPRVNLKAGITYLKEDSGGRMQAAVVNVPVHQRHGAKDSECKTASVAQLVEDILNQDNSLRRGVIIQEDVSGSAQVMVYSLYRYVDQQDVKTYSAAHGAEYYEPEPEGGGASETLDKGTRKGIIESAKRSFLDTCQDQTSPGALRPEATATGNVKLFKSCIEKGDFDYLKSLQTAEEQEPPQSDAATRREVSEPRAEPAEESSAEWVPVDMKRLKSLFSGNQNQTAKPHGYDLGQQPALVPSVPQSQQPGPVSDQAEQASLLGFDGQDDRVLQAELVQVVDENDEISGLQTAIQDLQQATMEARALSLSAEETGRTSLQESSERHSGSSAHSAEGVKAQEEEEAVFHGTIRAALDSLEKSNVNVSKGDFRAAMIYRNSSKPSRERPPNADVVSDKKPTGTFHPITPQEDPPVKEEPATTAKPPQETRISNVPGRDATSDKNRRPVGPKPAIPPKPQHLATKERNDRHSDPIMNQTAQNKTATPRETLPKPPHATVKTSASREEDPLRSDRDPLDHQDTQFSSKSEQMSREPDIICSHVASTRGDTDSNVATKQQNVTAEENSRQEFPVEENLSENQEEKHVDFNEACQKFGGKKKKKKIAPVKPKRVKIAQPVQVVPDPSRRPADEEKRQEAETRVEMREKKGRSETEDERRQRLSVHMEEIVRGNTAAAMEIFHNLRKQEELQSLLSRVEEIEQDTSEVDVRSLRSVFENVPEWVVSAGQTEPMRAEEENKDKRPPSVPENSQTKTSMAHVFGDLERASEEIMNLKEQTLARLVDIEETIKKALYSVSTLKSDSDIAGLSCLFRESLGAAGSPSSGNISKISIESSRKSQRANGSANAVRAAGRSAGSEASSPKRRSSPPSSPAFISIQSAARKPERAEGRTCRACRQSGKAEETFRTTKTLPCSSPAGRRRGGGGGGGGDGREVSVLQLHTDRQGRGVVGTTTVTENYERKDNLGNRFYSSKTSTVVTSQPESPAAPSGGPAAHRVTAYPQVQLPVNQRPQ